MNLSQNFLNEFGDVSPVIPMPGIILSETGEELTPVSLPVNIADDGDTELVAAVAGKRICVKQLLVKILDDRTTDWYLTTGEGEDGTVIFPILDTSIVIEAPEGCYLFTTDVGESLVFNQADAGRVAVFVIYVVK